ncbi:MAG TPA: thioesterase family protein [Acidimicrobiales bacterium]|nr:thioesterase family protein [Acidimicrobiales bacterium]
MATLPEAFYLPAGDGTFEPTEATTSPWDASAQHGGPPTALVATMMQAAADEPASGLRLARVTAELLGPIPRRTVTVRARVARPGRRVCMTEATLAAADDPDRPAVLARAWHIATAARPPAPASPPPAPPGPIPGADEVEPYRPLLGLSDGWGYGAAIDWRFTDGAFHRPGPARVWTRLRIPFVAGAGTTSVQRALVVADAANGVSAELPAGWGFIPTSVTVHLRRHPAGEWVHMAAITAIGDDGVGLTTGTLADPDGEVGVVTQPLLITPMG